MEAGVCEETASIWKKLVGTPDETLVNQGSCKTVSTKSEFAFISRNIGQAVGAREHDCKIVLSSYPERRQ